MFLLCLNRLAIETGELATYQLPKAIAMIPIRITPPTLPESSSYYKGDEWNNLTRNQRNYLRSEKAKKKTAGKENKRKGTHLAVVQAESEHLAKVELKVQALETMIASMKAAHTTREAEQPATKRSKVVRN